MLGRAGLTVPRIVVGAMAYREGDAARERVLHAAIERGLFAIDTAPLYGFGRSESQLGRVLAGVRGRVRVLDKVGLRWDGDHGEILFEAIIDGQRRAVRRDSRPRALRADVEGSLARLGIERIDLCQIHHPDPLVPIEEAIGELLVLRREGKIDAIGVSNFDDDQLRRAHAALGPVPLCSHQLPLSLLRPAARTDAVPSARALGCGVLAYSPLAAGALAGRDPRHAPGPDDDRRWAAEFSPESRARIVAATHRALLPIAARHDATVAQVALAWVLAQDVDAAIVGVGDVRQIDDAIAATQLALSQGECETLARSFADVHCVPAPPPSLGQRVLGKARRWWSARAGYQRTV
ncbi:MAG: aldo/keto reductase [Deltaproteobacteria bacterium]|nr:aldo/keto reductase [Deltaproteobacteria bacterium]MBK8717586.1 aldo/keto reductase [Deltaproteobacteria bacterium]MBP7285805.1 aldo/keto reductase [Nannocystaceae bacterium]